MNTQLKNYVIILLLFITGKSFAQNVDNTRMKRDIEVAENILSTLINQESDLRFGNNIEGTYIEGNGVLFTIGSGSFYKFSYSSDVFVSGQLATTVAPSRKDEGSKAKVNLDSLQTKYYASMKNVMKVFITDYAYLLSQLQPNEKILLRYGENGQFSNFVIAGTLKAFSSTTNSEENKNSPKELTAEISKTSLDETRAGKLTKAQLEERIKFTEKASSAKKDAELELLSSIFNRLYQDDLSETFQMRGNPTYEKIEGLGAVFNLNFGGWNKGYGMYSGDNFGARAWKSEEKEAPKAETAAERNQKIKTDYPKFIEGFKQNVIEYGRTVQNLGANELLIFKLRLNPCEACETPQSVEISLKKSVLDDYNKNKLSLEQAVQQIKVKTSEK